MKNYQLSNGQQIPALGFGTWKLADGPEVIQAVKDALAVGYRHIDTAQYYDNERGIGTAMKESGLERSEIFLTTKVWNDIGTYEDTLASVEESLEKLQTTYVDLLLIHWPNPIAWRDTIGYQKRNQEVWRAFETLYEAGKVKAIGVSNFMPHHLDALLETAEVKPMVNQIKLTPGLLQEEAVAYSRDLGMVIEAYSPFGGGDLFQNEAVQAMAAKHQTSVGQLALAWSLAHDFLPLPRSSRRENIARNFDLSAIQLSSAEIEALDHLTIEVVCPDPDTSRH